MTSVSFDYVLNLIRDKINKCDTNYRRSTSAEEHLLITLRFLAMGERFQSLHYYFRLEATTIGKIVTETYPEKVITIRLACCILHNLIQEREEMISEIHEELLQIGVEEITERNNSNLESNVALKVRNNFVNFFNSNEGFVPWQDKYTHIIIDDF
ncbi:hypothetical protein PGB90_008583 [Kerria lacca]